MEETQDAAKQTVLATLGEELEAMRAFNELLRQEQQALLGQDGDLVLALAEKKTALALRLSGLAETRRKALASLSASSTEQWLQQHAPERLEAWHTLQQLAQTAQQSNLTNGKLINIKLRSNQQMLSALYNAAQHTTADLYGRDGQQNLAGVGRSLGSV